MIALATMGKFAGPVPVQWDSGSSGGGEVKYIHKKLPTVRVNKVEKSKFQIYININGIKEN